MVSVLQTCIQGAGRIGRLGGLVLVLFILAGCSLRDGSATILMGDTHPPFSRVSVLQFKDTPVQMAASLIPAKRADKSIIEPNASSVVRKIFAEKVKENPAYHLIDDKELAGLYRYADPSGLPREDRARFFVALGKQLKSEALLIGYVHRYRERKGTSYAVVQPASVAFQIELVRAKDGITVWKGYFDKTQRSLMENLLELASFRMRRGRWVSARDLAEEGIVALLQKIPVLKGETAPPKQEK